MSEINWGLATGPSSFDNALTRGFQLGSAIADRREQKEYRDQQMQVRQSELDARLAERQAAAAKEQRERQRADIPMLGRLLEYGAQGEQQWQQALQVARQYDIPLDNVPQQFDPVWAKSQATMLKTLQSPEGQEALSTAGKIAADMGYKPGTPEHANATREIYLAGEAKPYVVGGETRLYTPKIGGVGEAQGSIPPAAVEALKRGEGTPEQFDEMFGAGAAARFMGQGGQPAQGSSPFDQAFQGL